MGRKTKVALTVGAVGAASVAAWAASKVVAKPIPREDKEALNFDKPVVLAYHGGHLEAPENTLAAFSKAAELGVHGFAVDIRLTKDEEIIVFHDEFADRTTDFSGKITDYTLSELKKADAGYRFEDEAGHYPYRGLGEKIVTLRELLEQFPHMLIAINLKDSPDTYEGSLMPSKLWGLLNELDAEDRVAVTGSYDEQTDRFNLYAQNRVATGAGDGEVKKAYAAFTSKLGHLYNPRADLFRVSEKLGVFPLGTENFIHFLKRLNVRVYFEDVTEQDSLIKLLSIGASGFITDRPAMVMKIIQEHIGE
ncbi:glycerophosphodiester phosphodiesterase family protein [Sporosarcina sp. FSL K6-2383]|uniref:glycerophosphodiester phosphodiesterase family protein n=1 Tax=Sporosarcina sp. FSL K6-2383 TaxID=2921556 RepID=UPI00315A79C6